MCCFGCRLLACCLASTLYEPCGLVITAIKALREVWKAPDEGGGNTIKPRRACFQPSTTRIQAFYKSSLAGFFGFTRRRFLADTVLSVNPAALEKN